jgi:type 1 glutamine amidotransferase
MTKVLQQVLSFTVLPGWICLLLVANVTSPALTAPPPLKVLLLSGDNNHDWQKTTPALVKIYQESQAFDVNVTEDPSRFTAQSLAPYDVIVSNWTNWPQKDRIWGTEAETAFLDFVRQGKGVVIVHAASACFYTWPEYHQLVGATWGPDTGHGPVHRFDVHAMDQEHPITQGLRGFSIKDELWHRMARQPSARVICKAFSAKDKGGTGNWEPAALVSDFGQGRSFYLILGHDVPAMQTPGWATLLLRGTEWAATAQASLPIPPDQARPENSLAWQETDESLALLNNEKTVWQLNFTRSEGKPYFHPLGLADGTALTWLRPADHPWHRALWFSWKYINGLNYWEEDKTTGRSEGLSEIDQVKVSCNDDHSASIHMTLNYNPPEAKPVLTETRRLRVSPPNEMGQYHIDWESSFIAQDEDVVLGRTPILGEDKGVAWGGYAGLSLRMLKEARQWQFRDSEGDRDMQAHGKEARWVDYSGETTTGQSAGIAVFDHPQNLRHPSPWYVAKPITYFSPAPLFHKPYTLKKGKTLLLKYRILVHAQDVDQAFLNTQWLGYTKP